MKVNNFGRKYKDYTSTLKNKQEKEVEEESILQEKVKDQEKMKENKQQL